MWYDLSVKIPRNRVDEEISEPFSMDLDVAWDEMTGQPEVIESQVMQDIGIEAETDKGGDELESETTEEIGLQEPCEMQEKTLRDETLDAEEQLL